MDLDLLVDQVVSFTEESLRELDRVIAVKEAELANYRRFRQLVAPAIGPPAAREEATPATLPPPVDFEAELQRRAAEEKPAIARFAAPATADPADEEPADEEPMDEKPPARLVAASDPDQRLAVEIDDYIRRHGAAQPGVIAAALGVTPQRIGRLTGRHPWFHRPPSGLVTLATHRS